MKNLSLISLAIVSMIASASYAKDYYVSGQVGTAIAQGKLKSDNMILGVAKKSLNNTVVFNMIVGRNVTSDLSAELEVAYAKHKFSRSNTEIDLSTPYSYKVKSNVSSISSFVNANYKFQNINSSVIPYINAGVGFSSNKMGGISYDVNPSSFDLSGKRNTTNNFSWQVGIGALISVKENISLNLSCKYRDLGKLSSAKNVTDSAGDQHDSFRLKGKLRTLNLMVGVTFDF